MVALISTNSSLLRSLAYLSPVRDDLFVDIIHEQKNEPRRGDLFVNVGIINGLIRTKYFFSDTIEILYKESQSVIR